MEEKERKEKKREEEGRKVRDNDETNGEGRRKNVGETEECKREINRN